MMKALFRSIMLLLIAGKAISQPVSRPPLTGIAFVEIQVTSLDSAATFYRDFLGYNRVDRPGCHSYRVNHRQHILVRGDLPAGRDERLLSLGFHTSDLVAMRAYLKYKGYKMLTGSPDSIALNDPDGHRIIFVQAAPVPPDSLRGKSISDRILHAGLTIASQEQADAFYKNILEFEEIWRGGANDTTLSWINMRLPESTDYLEYMLLKPPVPRRQLGSAHHVALLVGDMQKAIDILRVRKGIVPAPRIGRNSRWQLNLFDPDGTRVELMEPFTAR